MLMLFAQTDKNASLKDYINDLVGFDATILIRISLVLLVALLSHRIAHEVIKRAVRSSLRTDPTNPLPEEAKKREKTLIHLMTSISRIFIFILAVMLILSELGLDIGPMIAGVSFLGIAVGFGAQSLIKDFAAGMFIILENQFRVGDVVSVSEVSGKVESIGLRTTVLRDLDGNQHHVPNGSINVATNMTSGFARINLDFLVSFDADITLVKSIIDKIGEDMSQDVEWSHAIISAPYFVRVSNFDVNGVVVKVLGKVQPGQQWAVAGELRDRVRKEFAINGVEIPYQQVVLHDDNKSTKPATKKNKK